jgi:FKBP-type peptidyl-prolyl cis-trans isomerase 2
MIISSQHYIDKDIVAAKSAACDYTVLVGKVIEIDGNEYQVVLDGNHSLAAAKRDGVAPVIVTATERDSDKEAIQDVNDYLMANWIYGDYYDTATGLNVW